MATAAKSYLELLLRSREATGIEQIDRQLHQALVSDKLDAPQQDLVRLWLRHVDAEKERRQAAPVMM